MSFLVLRSYGLTVLRSYGLTVLRSYGLSATSSLPSALADGQRDTSLQLALAKFPNAWAKALIEENTAYPSAEADGNEFKFAQAWFNNLIISPLTSPTSQSSHLFPSTSFHITLPFPSTSFHVMLPSEHAIQEFYRWG